MSLMTMKLQLLRLTVSEEPVTVDIRPSSLDVTNGDISLKHTSRFTNIQPVEDIHLENIESPRENEAPHGQPEAGIMTCCTDEMALTCTDTTGEISVGNSYFNNVCPVESIGSSGVCTSISTLSRY